MHCREILFTPRCSPRAREFPWSVHFFVRRTVAELHSVKLPNFGILAYFPIQNAKNVPSSDQLTAQGLHCRMIPVFPCGSRRSKGVPSGSGVFIRLLGRGAGEWGPQTCLNLRLWQISIPIQNASTRRVRSGPMMSEKAPF